MKVDSFSAILEGNNLLLYDFGVLIYGLSMNFYGGLYVAIRLLRTITWMRILCALC